jgi:hypothetical protein
MDKPRLDQGPDYERGFIDGMMYQTQTTVNMAVDAMSRRTHTPEDVQKIMKQWAGLSSVDWNYFNAAKSSDPHYVAQWAEDKLKEKNT